MEFPCYILVICLFSCVEKVIQCVNPIARTKTGIFQGKNVHFQGYKVNEYLGIPYAKPPIGDLRFQKPRKLKSSPDQVFQAVRQPPACPQFTKNPFPWYSNSSHKNEDCLFLNIWTPADDLDTDKKAVFYWIYGGGFRYDSINLEVHSGLALAALGNVIVVTVNYRVGPFGYLTTGTKAAPGNVGLWDVLEGLKWVNKHIEAFGGDKTRITIAGESAGSYAVGLLSVSPLAEGLYTGAIMQSGAPTYLFAENNTQDTAFSQELAKHVKCANDTFTIDDHPDTVLKCLKSLDATTISLADSFIKPHSPMLYVPQYGDELLPKNARLAVSKGEFRCTRLLIGVNQDEGSLLIPTSNPQRYGFFGHKNAPINKTTGEEIILNSNFFQNFPNLHSVLKHYLPEDVPSYSYDYVREQVFTLMGDAILVCPSVYYAEQCAAKGNKVYYYYFAHRPSDTPWAHWMGVAHFEEVKFVFGQPVLHPERFTISEVAFSRQLIDIWSSFVKTGTPGVEWPLFSREGHKHQTLGCPTTGLDSHVKNCEFFRSTFGFE